MSLLFAATHPRACRALCVVGGFARLVRSEDYPHGFPAHLIEETYARFAERWGQPAMIDLLGPTVAGDEREREIWARFERVGSNPGAVRAVGRMVREVDLRPVLPQIRVPTLIVHAAGTWPFRSEPAATSPTTFRAQSTSSTRRAITPFGSTPIRSRTP
jgi:pimeloyl-ACP methyl ester carboxylesterase